mmetsp:Transcript_13786/g.29733  ORF Transcript_13786/g.29733 Transcript_13786/m.29733 type:complete len:359 (-) Transcript_13786:849-1925(-)
MKRAGKLHKGKMQGSAMVTAATLIACGMSVWVLLRLRSKSSSSKPIHQPAKAAIALTWATADEGSKGRLRHSKEHALQELHLNEAAQKLVAVYQKVEDDFLHSGLNLPGIKAMQPWFHGVSDGETPWPKRYDEFAEPLPPHAVRLLVIPLEDSPALGATAAAVTRDILQLLPASAKHFSNARTNYHCTIFHTSHPLDTRADALLADGGVPDLSLPCAKRRGPTSQELQQEADTVRRVAEAGPSPMLVLDRVVMANSGTLLITWTDPSGYVEDLRQRLKTAFPGATSKQASIIHTSLMRIVDSEQLTPGVVAAVGAKCKEWTDKLRGKIYTPPALWWVVENEFSTINGDRTRLLFAQES